MKMQSSRTQWHKDLVCPSCGNKNRFIEVMAEEVHLVNGRRNYIRLLEAVTDHYVCCECGETIEAECDKHLDR